MRRSIIVLQTALTPNLAPLFPPVPIRVARQAVRKKIDQGPHPTRQMTGGRIDRIGREFRPDMIFQHPHQSTCLQGFVNVERGKQQQAFIGNRRTHEEFAAACGEAHRYAYIAGQAVKKTVVVPGRLVNIVV